VLVENFRRKERVLGGGEHAAIVGTILKGQGVLFSVPSGSESKDLFSELPYGPLNFDWFFETCRKAGQEVVREGRITPETAKILERPLVDIEPEAFYRIGEKFVDNVLAKIGS
jgi:hypothetical protein